MCVKIKVNFSSYPGLHQQCHDKMAKTCAKLAKSVCIFLWGASIYDVRKILGFFDPPPLQKWVVRILCTVSPQNWGIFWPPPPSVRTSYMEAPYPCVTKLRAAHAEASIFPQMQQCMHQSRTDGERRQKRAGKISEVAPPSLRSWLLRFVSVGRMRPRGRK